MLTALTHLPSPWLRDCELTFVERRPIDYPLALDQHREYCDALRACGAEVLGLAANHQCPDSVFIEDAAIVLDECAVLASMGKRSRRGEIRRIEPKLARYRPIERIRLPATIEGGDILRMDKALYVGISSRTNRAGMEALRTVVNSYGYTVKPVPLTKCVHLKTACSSLDDETILINPAWVDPDYFREYRLILAPASEPWAANVARVGEYVCTSAAFPMTADLLCDEGFKVCGVNLSEFAKAEAGPTCLSLIFNSSM